VTSHRTAHETEREAGRSIERASAYLRDVVMQLLLDAGAFGLTDDEGGLLVGGDRLDFGRRRHELAVAGDVVKSGHHRPTPHGRRAIVWRAKRYQGEPMPAPCCVCGVRPVGVEVGFCDRCAEIPLAPQGKTHVCAQCETRGDDFPLFIRGRLCPSCAPAQPVPDPARTLDGLRAARKSSR